MLIFLQFSVILLVFFIPRFKRLHVIPFLHPTSPNNHDIFNDKIIIII